METNRWLDSRIESRRKRNIAGKEILRCSGGTFTIRRGAKRLESVDEKAKEKGTRKGRGRRRTRGGIRGEDEVEEEERKTKKKSRSLESCESHLIIIINSNLGILPPEGTSRLHREGRAYGGEANVVKAGCVAEVGWN